MDEQAWYEYQHNPLNIFWMARDHGYDAVMGKGLVWICIHIVQTKTGDSSVTLCEPCRTVNQAYKVLGY